MLMCLQIGTSAHARAFVATATTQLTFNNNGKEFRGQQLDTIIFNAFVPVTYVSFQKQVVK